MCTKMNRDVQKQFNDQPLSISQSKKKGKQEITQTVTTNAQKTQQFDFRSQKITFVLFLKY